MGRLDTSCLESLARDLEWYLGSDLAGKHVEAMDWLCERVSAWPSESVRVLAELVALRAQVQEMREVIRDMADSGVAMDDERIGWVEVQVDRATWNEVLRLARAIGEE